MSYALRTSISGSANSSGVCTLTTTPGRAGQSWLVTRISTTVVPTNTKERMQVYFNGISQLNYVDGTRRANSDTSETAIEVGNLDSLTFVFSGCNPGATCSINLTGKIEVNNRGIQ